MEIASKRGCHEGLPYDGEVPEDRALGAIMEIASKRRVNEGVPCDGEVRAD
jgi:hypothetical protein